MCSKTTVAPLDRIKILLQAHQTHYKHLGVFSGLMNIVKKESFIALYKGNGAQMVRIFPYAATQFTAFEIYKKVMKSFCWCLRTMLAQFHFLLLVLRKFTGPRSLHKACRQVLRWRWCWPHRSDSHLPSRHNSSPLGFSSDWRAQIQWHFAVCIVNTERGGWSSSSVPRICSNAHGNGAVRRSFVLLLRGTKVRVYEVFAKFDVQQTWAEYGLVWFSLETIS